MIPVKLALIEGLVWSITQVKICFGNIDGIYVIGRVPIFIKTKLKASLWLLVCKTISEQI
jgi:hypothetical protein